jgi:plastocyanin
MSRIRFALLAAAVAGFVFVTAASAAPVKLTAVVGPGFNISLKKGSTKVTKLKAGKYTISVSDKSNIHNFHLTGPGVNKRTSVSGTGTTTWHVRLRRGTYRYVCDPHASMMKGSFTVR